jgi:hypothetical protein
MTFQYERRGDAGPAPVKTTLRLSPEAATILRGVAADWNLPQHDALELLAKWFVITGGHLQRHIDLQGEPAARIAVAVTDWRRRMACAGSDAGTRRTD